jgi:putative flippase GtrA
MRKRRPVLREIRYALSFGGVGLVGFCVDASLLHLGLELGLSAWAARIVSLFCAMQATFAINGLHVFRCLDRTKLVRQWIGYMLANGFGNFCNYWIFVTLVSIHRPTVSNHYFALAAGSLSAWMINFMATRLFVFGPALTRIICDEEAVLVHRPSASCATTAAAPDGPLPDREPV